MAFKPGTQNPRPGPAEGHGAVGPPDVSQAPPQFGGSQDKPFNAAGPQGPPGAQWQHPGSPQTVDQYPPNDLRQRAQDGYDSPCRPVTQIFVMGVAGGVSGSGVASGGPQDPCKPYVFDIPLGSRPPGKSSPDDDWGPVSSCGDQQGKNKPDESRIKIICLPPVPSRCGCPAYPGSGPQPGGSAYPPGGSMYPPGGSTCPYSTATSPGPPQTPMSPGGGGYNTSTICPYSQPPAGQLRSGGTTTSQGSAITDMMPAVQQFLMFLQAYGLAATLIRDRARRGQDDNGKRDNGQPGGGGHSCACCCCCGPCPPGYDPCRTDSNPCPPGYDPSRTNNNPCPPGHMYYPNPCIPICPPKGNGNGHNINDEIHKKDSTDSKEHGKKEKGEGFVKNRSKEEKEHTGKKAKATAPPTL